jgi:hypothetical protein
MTQASGSLPLPSRQQNGAQRLHIGHAVTLERITFDIRDCFSACASGEINDEFALSRIAKNLDVLAAHGVVNHDAVFQSPVLGPQNCTTHEQPPIVMLRNYEQFLDHFYRERRPVVGNSRLDASERPKFTPGGAKSSCCIKQITGDAFPHAWPIFATVGAAAFLGSERSVTIGRKLNKVAKLKVAGKRYQCFVVKRMKRTSRSTFTRSVVNHMRHTFISVGLSYGANQVDRDYCAT